MQSGSAENALSGKNVGLVLMGKKERRRENKLALPVSLRPKKTTIADGLNLRFAFVKSGQQVHLSR